MKKKVFAILLSLAMVVTMMPVLALTVFAENNSVDYLDKIVEEDGTVTTKPLSVESYKIITENDTVWGNGGEEPCWYLLNTDVTLKNRPEVKGDVRIILRNGKTLTANLGITVETGNSFSIYGQSDVESEMGILSITGCDEPAIGGRDGADGATFGPSAHKDTRVRDGAIDAQAGTSAGTVSFFGGKSILIVPDGAVIGGGNGGLGGIQNSSTGDNPYLGNGGNGGNGGSVFFYGGYHIIHTGNTSAIGGGLGGAGKKSGKLRGDNGTNGSSATVTVFGSPEIKAGEMFEWIETVDSYNGQSALSVAYIPSDNGGDNPVNPFNPGDHIHSGSLQRGVTPSGKTVTYYKCDCGKYFEDAACTKEITDLNAWLRKDSSGDSASPSDKDKPETIIQTGDTNNMTPWIGLMLISLMGLAVCIVSIKRKGE